MLLPARLQKVSSKSRKGLYTRHDAEERSQGQQAQQTTSQTAGAGSAARHCWRATNSASVSGSLAASNSAILACIACNNSNGICAGSNRASSNVQSDSTSRYWIASQATPQSSGVIATINETMSLASNSPSPASDRTKDTAFSRVFESSSISKHSKITLRPSSFLSKSSSKTLTWR